MPGLDFEKTPSMAASRNDNPKSVQCKKGKANFIIKVVTVLSFCSFLSFFPGRLAPSPPPPFPPFPNTFPLEDPPPPPEKTNQQPCVAYAVAEPANFAV